jgi:DNA-binding IclR family transcriptional regulator
VQSVDRVVSILTILAAGPASGMRLTDIARKAGLDKATASRILDALCHADMVCRDAEERLFQLGSEQFFLGMAAQRNFTLVEDMRPAVQALATRTGDTAFLSMRSGNHSLCALRETGDYPVQIRTLNVGSRRPLGIGGSSLAILAALPEEERETVLTNNAEQIGEYPRFSVDFLRDEVRRTHQQGYVFTQDHLIKGVWCVATVVRNPKGLPLAGVGVASIPGRFEGNRLALQVQAVREAAMEMEFLLKNQISARAAQLAARR